MPNATTREGPEIEVRPAEGFALVAGRGCPLSRQELGLLDVLLTRAGHVVPRDELARIAWHRPLAGGDRSVDRCVFKLRRKLRRVAPAWQLIQTHPGHGYRFAPECADDHASTAVAP